LIPQVAGIKESQLHPIRARCSLDFSRGFSKYRIGRIAGDSATDGPYSPA
jgi:hypothetical protein